MNTLYNGNTPYNPLYLLSEFLFLEGFKVLVAGERRPTGPVRQATENKKKLMDWLINNSVLVYKKASLYNETWVKKAHLRAKSRSLQGRPLDKFGRYKSREINVK